MGLIYLYLLNNKFGRFEAQKDLLFVPGVELL